MEIFESSAVNPTLLRPRPPFPSIESDWQHGREKGRNWKRRRRRTKIHFSFSPPPRHFVCFPPSPSLRLNGNKRKRGLFFKSQRSYVVRWRQYTSPQKSVCVWPFWGKLQGCIVTYKASIWQGIIESIYCRGKGTMFKWDEKTYLKRESPSTQEILNSSPCTQTSLLEWIPKPTRLKGRFEMFLPASVPPFLVAKSRRGDGNTLLRYYKEILSRKSKRNPPSDFPPFSIPRKRGIKFKFEGTYDRRRTTDRSG